MNDQHNAEEVSTLTKGLLDGVRVLDFTSAAVGPFCSRMLADMGADVVRIEWPMPMAIAMGLTDRFAPESVRAGSIADILFLHCNGGKKSVGLNLKEPEGLDLVRRLVRDTDIVVENFTPRVMKSYGLDYEALSEINPRIIMCSLTGYGQQGLGGNTSHPCTDPIAQAMGGLNWITGERNGKPYAIGGGIGDTMTSMAGAIAIGFAMYDRERTGKGQHIDLSMVETCVFVDCTAMPYVAANNGETPSVIYRNGQLNSYTCPMGPLKAKDGYIALQAPGPGPESPWGRLCQTIGREDLISDPRFATDRDRLDHTDELVEILEDWLQSLPDDEVALALLADARISSGPVLSQEQILDHSFFKSRGTFRTIEYPELGPIQVVEPPFKFSRTPAHVQGPAPQIGEHNTEVLSSYLKLSESEIAKLTASGILFESTASQARKDAGKPAAL